MAIVLTRTIIEKNLSCVSFLSDNLFNFVHVSTIIWWMFCLVLMKAKVGASRCDLYHTDRRSSVQSKSFFFFLNTGWDLKKKKKKDLHRLSNFYNWLLICILYQWSFLYWKLKEKKNLYWKKNCLASQCGLTLTRSQVLASWWFQAIFSFFFFFNFNSFSKRCLVFDLTWISVCFLRFLH